MRKITAFLFAVMFLFSGCERKYDINERLIVQGVAIDYISENETEVTVQALNTDTYSGIGGAKVPEKLVKNFTLKGKSVASALSKLASFSGGEPLYTHTRIILIGNEQAKHGIRDVIDFFSRDSSCHASLCIAVCEGNAGEILKGKNVGESVPAVETEKALSTSQYGADSVNIHIYELIKMYREKTTSVFLPMVKTVKTGEDNEVRVSGTAVFGTDRMTYTIDENDTLFLMLFLNRIKLGTYTLESFDGDASFDFYKSRCKTDVSVGENGKTVFSVQLKCTVDCIEYSSKNGTELDVKMQEELEKKLESELSRKLKSFLYKMSRNKNDCMRLGRVLLLKNPEKYKEDVNNWQNILPTLSFDVSAKVSLRRIGQESGKSAL